MSDDRVDANFSGKLDEFLGRVRDLQQRETELHDLCAEICATFMVPSNQRHISQELKLIAKRWKSRFDQIVEKSRQRLDECGRNTG